MRTAPPQTSPLDESVPAADQCPAHDGREGQARAVPSERRVARSAVVRGPDQVLRVTTSVGAPERREDPTGVRVPEPLQRLERAFAEIGVRAVRIAGTVGELVVLAMVGHPGHDVALDAHLTEHGEQVADPQGTSRTPGA